MYRTHRKSWTSKPEDWPQKKFKEKNCKHCGNLYTPNSPCNLYCTEVCAKEGKASAYLQREYGISIMDYWNMWHNQEGVCAICKKEGFKMKEHHNLLLVVDHCHTSGKVRGLLCHNCNRGLGLLKDSIKNLESAKDYLEGATTISKESTPKRVEAPGPTEESK